MHSSLFGIGGDCEDRGDMRVSQPLRSFCVVGRTDGNAHADGFDVGGGCLLLESRPRELVGVSVPGAICRFGSVDLGGMRFGGVGAHLR